ncbi:MAG: hypothetical protein EU539_06190 [Promethearchaeota archaeon]|nr:MAG: hypothetical protein EU539_06190 [Candidatus Lokiarchaeota archaeon]
MILSLLEIVMATFSIIIVAIFALVGIEIIKVYKKTNERVYLCFGLTWIGIVEAWIPSAIVLIGFFMTGGSILPPTVYFLIAIAGYPLTTLIWITGFTDILYKNKQKLFQLIFGIGEVLFEIIFLVFLFTDANLIGSFKSPVDVAYAPFVSLYILISLCIILLTGLLISIISIRGGEPENKLRGYLLCAALITLFIGGLLDAAAELDILGVVIVRLLVISSAVEFYCAFVMPDFIKRLFKVET